MRTSLIKKTYRMFGGAGGQPGLTDLDQKGFHDFKLLHLINRPTDNISDTRIKWLFDTSLTEKQLVNKFGFAKMESNQAYYELPKIADNSINIYRASKDFRFLRMHRSFEMPFLFLGIFFTSFPLAFLASLGFMLQFMNHQEDFQQGQIIYLIQKLYVFKELGFLVNYIMNFGIFEMLKNLNQQIIDICQRIFIIDKIMQKQNKI